MSNKTAVLHGVRDLRIEDHEVPRPGPTQVVVRVEAVGICGSDVHYYEAGRIGEYVVRAPMVLGHEAAGTIVAAGDQVPPERIGQRVALEPGVPDGTCSQCRAGRYNLCPNVAFFATPPVDGALAQYVAIHEQFAHPAPTGLTAEQAAMAEPVSVGVWACRQAAVRPGDRVLVTGAGPVGLFAAQVGRAFGATEVAVLDVNKHRLAVARELGFETLPAGVEKRQCFDVLLECSGAPAAIADGLVRLAPGGRAALVGMGPQLVQVPLQAIQNRELTLTGTFRYANTYPLALSLLSSAAVLTDPVITHRLGIDDAEAALQLAHTVPDSLKAVVTP
ncbi:NAD(P)-dependent alcohol dehydrogenase [Dactylosporangium sp. NPDC050688]|uniref:NAD(P)-dependent alcohol dehydrogenase n=1 Tax=Dactylosporangium sp. NPDC050688 TaxID=3157217 RepID=UPI0033E6E376